MFYNVVFYSLSILIICQAVKSIELPVLERDLLPRDFNPHPLVGGGSQPIISNFHHPYAALVVKFSRRDDEELTRPIGKTVNHHRDIYSIGIKRRTISERTRGNIPDSSSHSVTMGKSWKMFVPSRRPAIVNYVVNDDGYRADISVGQREPPISDSVQDVSLEEDVHTGIALQSANLAEIQSTVRLVNAIDDPPIKYKSYSPFNYSRVSVETPSAFTRTVIQGGLYHGYESVELIPNSPQNLMYVNNANCRYFALNGQ